MGKVRPALKIVVKIALIAIATYLISYFSLHAAMPDCTPDQRDGQCGLATVYSALIPSVVTAMSALVLTIRHFRQRDRRDAEQHL